MDSPLRVSAKPPWGTHYEPHAIERPQHDEAKCARDVPCGMPRQNLKIDALIGSGDEQRANPSATIVCVREP